MGSETSLSAIQLLNQYSASWKMLQTAIDDSNDDLWSYSNNRWFYALTIHHIIETMDFYSRDVPDNMEWGKRAGYKWDDVKDISKDIIPLLTKDLLSEYLKEMEKRITTILTSISGEAFNNQDGFHWFDSVFQKYIYLLRHNQHHLGELAFVLRLKDAGIIKWT